VIWCRDVYIPGYIPDSDPNPWPFSISYPEPGSDRLLIIGHRSFQDGTSHSRNRNRGENKEIHSTVPDQLPVLSPGIRISKRGRSP
jgi:hypothetical protein